MNYYLYKPLSYAVRAQIKKECQSMGVEYKSQPWQVIWGQWLCEGVVAADISTPVVFLEQEWLESPVCMVPESHKLIESLARTNFEGQMSALNPRHRFFSIAIPKQHRFNGERIEGLFVSYRTHNEQARIVDNFATKYNLPMEMQRTTKTDPQLCITYKDPNGAGRVVLNLDVWQLAWVLEADNIDQYSALTRHRSEEVFYASNLSEHEATVQFDVLRFVLAFIVYMSAHEDCVLSVHDQTMEGSDKGTPRLRLETVKSYRVVSGISPHYRNLRHERFYQGEWSSWPPGSRWVPVNMDTEEVIEK